MELAEILQQLAMLEDFIKGYTAAQYTNYLAVAGYALYIADYFHTLPDEVRLMWPAPLSIPKVIFLALRYFTFLHIIFHAVTLGPAVSQEWCRYTSIRVGITGILLVVGSETILFLRVYAFTGRRTGMMLFLALLGMSGMAAAFVLISKFLQSIVFVDLPFPNVECLPASAQGNLAAGAFAATLANAIIVMLIMVYTAVRQHLDLQNKLFKILYRDGIVYFILLSALSGANVAVNFFAPDAYTFLFMQPHLFLGVILSTRMLLHLRDWATRKQKEGLPRSYQMGVMVSTSKTTYYDSGQTTSGKFVSEWRETPEPDGYYI